MEHSGNRLRDILYLDRERVEALVSQLAGGLVVEERGSSETSQDLGGETQAGLGMLNFKVGGKKGSASRYEASRIPAYAVLDLLETELRNAGWLATGTPTPGSIASVTGEPTFESWGLLASLFDNAQGIGSLAAKIYASKSESKNLVQNAKRLIKEYERLHKNRQVSQDQKATASQALQETMRRIGQENVWVSILRDGYLDDAKEVIKLFFQDQQQLHVRFAGRGYVGLLREDGLVGSTMEEVLFAYGSRPTTQITLLAQVTEFAKTGPLDMNEIVARFKQFSKEGRPLAVLQRAIRELGTAVLEVAEELRRPFGEDLVYVVPLAVYREIKPPSGIGPAGS